MIVVNGGGRRSKEFDGTLDIVVRVQRGGEGAIISFSPDLAQGKEKLHFEIKNFHRIEGAFSLPSTDVVKGVEVRLLQDGSVRAKQSVAL